MNPQTIEELRREADIAARLWVKVLGMMNQNWCLLEPGPEGAMELVFFDDHGNVFDSLSTASASAAHASLHANGFTWLREAPSFFYIGGMPTLPSRGRRQRSRPVYSSGEYWQSAQAGSPASLRDSGFDLAAKDLQRFVAAQDPHWYEVVEELAAGQKQSHWMWFVFPQLRGLGQSAMARHFGLSSPTEAAQFWDDDVLGSRLRTCIDLLLDLPGTTSAEQVFGSTDAVKLRSCLTLFEDVSMGDAAVLQALERFFGGQRCELSLQMLDTLSKGRKFRISRN